MTKQTNRMKFGLIFVRMFILVLIISICSIANPNFKVKAASCFSTGDVIVLNSDSWWVRSFACMEDYSKYAVIYDQQVFLVTGAWEDDWYTIILPNTGGQEYYISIPEECCNYFKYYSSEDGIKFETNWTLYEDILEAENAVYEIPVVEEFYEVEQTTSTIAVNEPIATEETTVLVSETTTETMESSVVTTVVVTEEPKAKTKTEQDSDFEIGDCLRFKGEFWNLYEVPIENSDYKKTEIKYNDEILLFKKYGNWFGIIDGLDDKYPYAYIKIDKNSQELFERCEHVDNFDSLHPFNDVTGPSPYAAYYTTAAKTTIATTTTTVVVSSPENTTKVDFDDTEKGPIKRGDLFRFNGEGYIIHTMPYLDSEAFEYIANENTIIVYWTCEPKDCWYRVQCIETQKGGYIYIPPNNEKYFEKVKSYTDQQMKEGYWRRE